MNTKKYATVGAICLAIFAMYQYGGSLLYYGRADRECIKFAEDNDIKPAWNDEKLFVARKWIKGSSVVVELGQTVESKQSYKARLCVIGEGRIYIPSVFEQWQYR
jgi:hypothetical protein